ncbi:DivIVA domain-containing protein [Sphaerisporangium sp. NPDC049002]|uniref:DivIVA domain-containing protein n=1 Tax=unclassified Sphaerisporangium TaxID=2630420 RepID=UPI003402E2EF
MNRFPRVLGVRTGYDPDQVDALIVRIEATLGRGLLEGAPVTADDIRMARFDTKLGGYNEVAVDYALDAFVVAVETRGAPAPESPQAAPVMERSGEILGSPVAGGFGDLPVRPAPGDLPGEWVAGRRPDAWTERVEVGRHQVPGGRHDSTEDPVEEDDEAPTLPGLGETPGGPKSPEAPNGQRPVAEALMEAWLETQAVRVERVLFRPGRLGAGYNEDEVDVFLDRIVATLRGTTDHPLTAEQVRVATFSTVMFKTGYAVAQVDAFLAEIADVLDRKGALAAGQEQGQGQGQRVPQE